MVTLHGFAFRKLKSPILRHLSKIRYCIARSFLSEAYLCNEEWQSRLRDPLITQVKTSSLYYEMDRRFNAKKPVSAVDVNVFANGVVEKDYLDELEDVVHRFRRTPSTVDAGDRLSHAVIRAFLDHDAGDALMRILNDRVNYGIFHDYYTANLMMDRFLNAKNYRDAAKVATLMMLQDDFDHPIARQLALYSCHMYLLNPQPEPWEPVQEKVEENDDEEEVIVRVRYIVQPYFDDHFDLRDHKHLIGKTLVGLAKDGKDAVGLTSQIIGWTLFEKWDKLSNLLNSIKGDPDARLMKDGVEMAKKLLSEFGSKEDDTPENEANEDSAKADDVKEDPPKNRPTLLLSLISELENSGQLVEGSTVELISERVKEACKTREAADISEQAELYSRWSNDRIEQVERQIAEFQREAKIDEIVKKKAELKRREQEVFFFENYEKHRLNIPPSEEDFMVNEEGKFSGTSLLDIPPEFHDKLRDWRGKEFLEAHEPWWRWEETMKENEDKFEKPFLRKFRGYSIFRDIHAPKTKFKK